MLARLLCPQQYQESDVQEAIEHYWPLLFPSYRICTDLIRQELEDYLPDIFAVSAKHNGFLIVEVKGEPPCSTRPQAIAQAVGYAKRYHTERSIVPEIRLLVIGPWKQPERIEYRGHGSYQVGLLSIAAIGHRLLKLAEDTLSWQMDRAKTWESELFDQP